MNILKINTQLLKNDQPIKVGIIDSGFDTIPSYAKLHGLNINKNRQHGNRILSIFSALDKDYPLNNLQLHLVCYNPNDEYDGLIKALNKMPYVDILSISLSWKNDNQQVKNLLFSKAKKICVPFTKDKPDLLYPSLYDGVITCYNGINPNADYSINPVEAYKGNSYAVPAVARLLAYNIDLKNDVNGVNIQQLFKNYVNPFNISINLNKTNNIKSSTCPFCNRTLRTKKHTLLSVLPQQCPYCGKFI